MRIEKDMKGSDSNLFKVLSQHMPGRNEENTEKPWLEYPLSDQYSNQRPLEHEADTTFNLLQLRHQMRAKKKLS